MTLTPNILHYGTEEPLPKSVALRAGPVSLVYQAGDLRYIRLGSREIVRRIYAAVRDLNWGTVPGTLQNEHITPEPDSFHIQYTCEHRQGEIQFAWKATVTGQPDGTLTFDFEGQVLSSFRKNRVGFCVLHPRRECAGQRCYLEYLGGDTARSQFPKDVAPVQPVPTFHDLRAIAHEVVPGTWAIVRMEGDSFELEDQRNWIDASFKTFGTPLRIPFPATLHAGQRVHQTVSVQLVDIRSQPPLPPSYAPTRTPTNLERVLLDLATQAPRATAAVSLTADPGRDTTAPVTVTFLSESKPLPPLGLGGHTDGRIPVEHEAKRIEALQLSHTRLDLDLSKNWRGDLFLGAGTPDCDTNLELALLFPSVSPMIMKDLAKELEERRPQLVRLLVLHRDTPTSPEPLLKLARKHLEHLDVPIGGGTNADFYELNAARPPAELMDFVCFSMNPQVHASDNHSLVENLEAIPDPIQTARDAFDDMPVVVSPITLKPRFNAVATSDPIALPEGELPREVDPRQMSLLGAAWTLGAIKAAAEAGAASLTFYETYGWRGVQEREAGSPLPARFHSIPGAVFPMYHVFADLAEFKGHTILCSTTSDPLRVTSLVVRSRSVGRLWVANLTPDPHPVRLANPPTFARHRLLDATNAVQAMQDPDVFRRAWIPSMPATLTLPPFALLISDFKR